MHPAALHMLDVAAVAQAWLQAVMPKIPGLQGAVAPSLPALLTLVAMHDIGKFSRPFQAKVPELWPACLGKWEALSRPKHDTAGAALLEEGAFSARLAKLVPTLEVEDQRYLWRAVCGHHGRPPEEGRVGRATFCPAARDAAMAFLDDLLALFAPPPLMFATDDDFIAFCWWLAGFTVLCDWIGSAIEWFPYPVAAASLEEYWPLARERAEKALSAAGLLPAPPAPRLEYAALIGANPPSPLQQFVETVALPMGPLLLLIEDQMGSGKTEAALMLAHRLMVQEHAAGLFMAVPTMATANALYARISHTYRALFAAGSQPSLVLAHSKRHLNEHFAAALRHGELEQVDDDADETASAQCAAWIADDRRRSFLAACGVGTIDQAILAVLPSRHAPLRLFGLTQRVLIIDEAHAYDDYVTEELRRLIEFQARQGGSTVVLSATLPRQTKNRLLEAFGGRGHCHKMGYPLLTVATRAITREYELPPRPGLERHIELHRLTDMKEALALVQAAAARGAAVGWIRNTVDDAITAHAGLASQGVAATLFHARFAMGDRLAIEDEVQARFGRTSQAAQRAHVLVGTQVMEQSLDLDFDVLISDLAPVDLLLQRAGRLWRHNRGRRPEDTPHFYVIAPAPVAAPDAGWLKDFRGTAAVYNDPALLWRPLRTLFVKPVLQLPADVRGLVEAVYASDAEVPPGLQQRSAAAAGAGMAERGMAWQNLLTWQAGYGLTGGAWLNDAVIATRLADPSRAYRLALWVEDKLKPICAGEQAWPMSEITLPLRRVQTVPAETGDRARALAALRAGWHRWEQDIPVLILVPGADGCHGEIIAPSGMTRQVKYDRASGLVWL